MAVRTFRTTLTVVVENEDAATPATMHFHRDAVAGAAEACVRLDLDTEDGENRVDAAGDNRVTGVSVDWSTLREVT